MNARGRDDRLPQVNVTYAEAVAVCGYLSKRDPGANYRLPTEAEWEFAARGAQNRDYPWGNAAPSRRIANLDGKALAPVGTFSAGATPEGVLDLIGNAAEWVVDWFGSYPAQDQTDPTGPRTGDKRVVRGSA